MIILVAVTLNIALGENGLIAKAKETRTKQEEQTIYEDIQGMMELDNNGEINVGKTFGNVVEKYTPEKVTPNTIIDGEESIQFTVQGEYGTYKYKITKFEITVDNEIKDTLAELKEKAIGNNILDFLNSGIDGLQLESALEAVIVSYKGEMFELICDTTTYMVTDVIRSNWIAFADEENYYDIQKNANGVTIVGLTDYGKTQLKKDKKLTIPAIIKATDGETYEVTKLRDYAFSIDEEVKNNIENLNFESNSKIEEIEEQTFSEFPNLTGNIIIPSSVKTIGKKAFWKTQISGELTIPASVTTIEDDAFSYTKLNSLIFEKDSSLENIGENAFYSTEISNVITIPANVKTIESNAFYNSKITGLKFQEGSKLEKIGASAFSISTLTGNIEIPASCSVIATQAFSNSGITGLKFNGPVNLEFGCFYDCKELQGEIYIYDNTVFNANGIFYHTSISKISMPANANFAYSGSYFSVFTYSEQFIFEFRGTREEYYKNAKYFKAVGLTDTGEIKEDYLYTIKTYDEEIIN